MIDVITLDYAAFELIAAKKKFFWQMLEKDTEYHIFGYDLPTKYETVIYKPSTPIQGMDMVAEAAKQADFEANHKDDCNRPNTISPTAAQTQFYGKTIALAANDTEGYCEWAFDTDTYVSKMLPFPIDAQKGDYVDLEVWTKPGVMGPDAVKVGQYGYTLYLTGSQCPGWVYGSGGGEIKSYCTVRCVYHKAAGTARDFTVWAEFLV